MPAVISLMYRFEGFFVPVKNGKSRGETRSAE
jgi:hypothetical protein